MSSFENLTDRPLRMLVVDDEPCPCEVFEYLFSEEANIEDPIIVDVDFASTIEDAIQKLQKAEYDLLVTDHMMPGGSGVELVLQIRNGKVLNRDDVKQIPIIVVSSGNPQHFKDSYPSDVKFFSKPYDLDDFINVVKSYCKRS